MRYGIREALQLVVRHFEFPGPLIDPDFQTLIQAPNLLVRHFAFFDFTLEPGDRLLELSRTLVDAGAEFIFDAAPVSRDPTHCRREENQERDTEGIERPVHRVADQRSEQDRANACRIASGPGAAEDRTEKQER